jgi:hypothetical protein
VPLIYPQDLNPASTCAERSLDCVVPVVTFMIRREDLKEGHREIARAGVLGSPQRRDSPRCSPSQPFDDKFQLDHLSTSAGLKRDTTFSPTCPNSNKGQCTVVRKSHLTGASVRRSQAFVVPSF